MVAIIDQNTLFGNPGFLPTEKPEGKIRVHSVDVIVYPRKTYHEKSQWPEKLTEVNIYIHWSIDTWHQIPYRCQSLGKTEAEAFRLAMHYLPLWLEDAIEVDTYMNLVYAEKRWSSLILSEEEGNNE